MGRGPVGSRRGPAGLGARVSRTSYFMYSAPPEHLRLGRRKTRTRIDVGYRWAPDRSADAGRRRLRRLVGGLLDEPGLEAPDCGFFICMKKATIIMNLRRRREGASEGANSNAGGGGVGGGSGGCGAEASLAAAGARRRAARASAHIINEEHGVVGRRLVPRRRQPEHLDSPSKHCVPVHRVALEGAEQLLHAWSLRPVLANAIHEVLPHRHGAHLRRAARRAEQKCGGI